MSKIKEMVEKELSIGDIVISDNLYYEFNNKVSIEDLSVKYQKTTDEIKAILKSLGVIVKDENKTI